MQKEIGSSVQSAVAMHAGPVTMCRSSVMMRRGVIALRILQVQFDGRSALSFWSTDGVHIGRRKGVQAKRAPKRVWESGEAGRRDLSN